MKGGSENIFDNEKLSHNLSLAYAQEISKSGPEDVDCIGEMNQHLLGASQDVYNLYSDKFGFSAK